MGFWTRDILENGIREHGWKVGEESYGAPVVHTWGVNGQLNIGKYCSFGSGVVVLLGGNHRVDWITTYPFSAISSEHPEAAAVQGHPTTGGDVIIGNDVWLGQSSVILSGVKIGDGAVVSPHTVVTKDVPPYTIVGGNPAEIIRKRFSDAQIDELCKIKWWNWSKDRLKKYYSLLLSQDIDRFIERVKFEDESTSLVERAPKILIPSERKIALCLSGQMRNYKDSYKSIIENIVEPLNADVFIHTWRNSGFSTKLKLYISHDLHKFISLDFDWDVSDIVHGSNLSKFEKVFPRTYDAIKKLAKSSMYIDQSDLLQTYGAKACIIEDIEKIDFSTKFDLDYINKNLATGVNMIPMFYKIWACDQLRKSEELMLGRRYDAVIRLRPDYIVPGQIPSKAIACVGGISTLYNPFYDAAGVKFSAFDAFSVGTSQAMTVYSDTWMELPNYLSPKYYSDWPINQRGPEAILYRQLAKIGAQDNIFHVEPQPYPAMQILDRETCIRLMLEDIGDNDEYLEMKVNLERAMNEKV